jgi:type IV/VI secretion system ImpK/VasF family protein
MDWPLRRSREPLALAARIADPADYTPPDQRRREAERLLAAIVLDDEGRRAGYTPADVADLRLALAALLDELALRSPGPLADAWRAAPLLQQRFVGEAITTAGDRFFERLDQRLLAPPAPLLVDPSTPAADPSRILRIYALVLLSGLRGRFDATVDRGEREAVLSRVHAALGPRSLHTPGPPALPERAPVAQPEPSRLLHWLTLAAALFIVTALLTHRLHHSPRLTDLERQIRALADRP